MSRRAKALFTTLIVILGVFLAAPQTGEAHRTVSADRAFQIVYNVYQSHCGNGSTWICDRRETFRYVYPMGYHSWGVEYHWAESQIFWSTYRNCAVIGRVEHDYFAEILRNEWCW